MFLRNIIHHLSRDLIIRSKSLQLVHVLPSLLVLASVHRHNIAPVIIVISHLYRTSTYTHASLTHLLYAPIPPPVLAREICLFNLFFASLICANRTHDACSIDHTRVSRPPCAVRNQSARYNIHVHCCASHFLSSSNSYIIINFN